ncbi:MAG: methionine--tRNA ligase [Ignavibacteria bacterium]|nr:methionine--tRNA ligase [Ignavibacteria bacterium]
MNNTKKILVTAALPYANGKIHLGHLAGAYLPADIYVRYQRAMKRDVVFICGSDEHGVPITITAEKENTTPKNVVDKVHELNKSAFEKCGMSFDNYSRTSLPLHHETAKEFFQKFYHQKILVEKKEQQFFDEKKQKFLPDRYVEGICPVCTNPEARGDQCEKCGSYYNASELKNPKSKLSGETPTLRNTTHFYFPLGNYQKRLEEYLKASSEKEQWKDNVLNACKGWFHDGLRDRAVTRDLDWGVYVPLDGYENKVLYVWFEAVLGYISSTKEWSKNIGNENSWKEYWQNENTKYVAFIGKDNIVFHCIVFPAMIMAWNDISDVKYVLPANVPANEFLNFEGQKFSKSKHWGIDVDDFLSEFPADILRYALSGILPENADSDFYWKDFQARVNGELADILGNFIHRTLTFLHKNFDGKIPQCSELTELDLQLISLLETTPDVAGKYFDAYKFRDGIIEVMNLARFANKYFNDSAPWSSLKNNPKQCATALNLCVQTIRSLAILFEPIIPFTVQKIFKMLNIKNSMRETSWESAKELRLNEGHPLQQPEILFSKIEDETIEKILNRMEQQTNTSTSHQANRRVSEPAKISIEDFRKIELRVAKILSCEQVPKSKKLLKIKVTLGTEERQILAGVAEHYKPEELIGKTIIVVANLEAAKLMGEESQGMMLAASDNNSNLCFVTTAKEMHAGSLVK